MGVWEYQCKTYDSDNSYTHSVLSFFLGIFSSRCAAS